MKIVVLGDDGAFVTLKRSNESADWIRIDNITSLPGHKKADAFFDLRDNNEKETYPDLDIPFFVNSVINANIPGSNVMRINAWDGFLQNTTWEVAGNFSDNAKKVLEYLGKKPIYCTDEPGFISARIIAMIINEAYFAKGENVSTEAAIDIAMKLGTNYPFGPFEWATKIGVQNIYRLLKKLSLHDNRYQPAPALAKLFEN